MTLDALYPSLPPTLLVGVIAWFARDKVSAMLSQLASLVNELKELRREIAEIAVLRVEVQHCKAEISAVRERSHDLANEVSSLKVQLAAVKR